MLLHPFRTLAKPARTRRSAALAAGLLAAGLLLTGCPGPREALEPRHVFFVTVDTLRADHMSLYGYARKTTPYLEKLGAQSVVFDRGIAQWGKTGVSFASMFTGQYPHSTGLTHKAAIQIPDGYLTLPELLKRVGFTTLAVNSNGVLSTDLGWNRGFDTYLETRTSFPYPEGDNPAYRASMNARRVNELALPLLEKHSKAERLFAWIHYSDPHTPYLLPKGFANPFLDDPLYQGDEQVVFENATQSQIDGRTDLKFYVAQYDANILVVDRAVQELVAHLERLGLLADSLIVLTADHGESLGEHGSYLEHGRLPYNTVAHVPLLVHEPYGRIQGRRVTNPVDLVDLYPTIRDLVASANEVAGLEGQSLVPFLRARDEGLAGAAEAVRFAFNAGGGGNPLTHYRAVQEGDWKLVWHPDLPGKKETRPAWYELYRLADDPLEARNLVAAHPEEVARLAPVLEEWMNGRTWISPPKGFVRTRSAETEKSLRSLGYVE